ncbi:MAG: NAD-dependent DNA ligase LigA [Spirochaetales bacterium]|nr:NAD-dependent DNA ligase LigA [Spirochaetales bacterium]
MEAKQAQEKIQELSEKLRQCQYEYYILSRPSVSDLEYDRLFDELQALESEFPDLAQEDSPTKRVGSDLSQDFPAKKHSIPVLSLDKCYELSELRAWMEKSVKNAEQALSFFIEEKIDGASIVLYYQKGRLESALTRGNGEVGNDVTGNVKTIGSVPLRLSDPVDLVVRGEIFLPQKYFDQINASMEVPYANPRNLASGTLRRIKSSEVARVPLDMFAYEGFFSETPASHVEVLARLKAYGFKLNPHSGYLGSDAESARQALGDGLFTGSFDDLGLYIEESKTRRAALEYDIDGLVCKVNEMSARESLGYTGHHPRWAMAFKFESPQGVTRVKKIDLQVGRTGRITPVARVEPVLISGSTITNITLHNQDYINALELGEGDEVIVSKRGDVIPSCERVVEHFAPEIWTLPPQCPSCGSSLVVKGAHHFCENPHCEAQLKGRLFFFAAKGQMDIENLGPETLNYLFDQGHVRRPADIFTFDFHRLEGEAGFGEKRVDSIRKGIEKARERPFQRLLPSLGIPDLGPKAAELLIEEGINSLDKLLEVVRQNQLQRLVDIPGIGEKTAQRIIDEFANPRLLEELEALRQAGLQMEASTALVDSGLNPVFQGQSWCVTGSFEAFKPRDLAAEEIKKRGGKVVSAVSSKTTHLLAGENAGSKLAKARSLGVQVVSEVDFLEMLK